MKRARRNRKLVEAGHSRVNISVEVLGEKGYKDISNVDIDKDYFIIER